MNKLMKVAVAVMAVATSGCAGFTWRLENKPSAWTDASWTQEFGKAQQVRVADGKVYVAAELSSTLGS